MAETDWKPGDVAIRTYLGGSGYTMRSMAVECPIVHHGGGVHWHHENGGWDPLDGDKTEYRRLLVIDPEDRETVERLTKAYEQCYEGSFATKREAMQAALNAMLEPPKPPKPDEPLGLGAAVHACAYTDEVRPFVRTASERAPWHDADGNGHEWAELDAVEVLSEGVR